MCYFCHGKHENYSLIKRMLIFYSVITGNCFRGILLNRFKWQVYKDNQSNWTCGRWYWTYVYLWSTCLIAYFAVHLLSLEQMVIYNNCDTFTGWHSKHSSFLWIYEEESKANKQTNKRATKSPKGYYNCFTVSLENILSVMLASGNSNDNSVCCYCLIPPQGVCLLQLQLQLESRSTTCSHQFTH